MTAFPKRFDQVENKGLTLPFELRILFSSITIFSSSQRDSKSEIVHKWIFAVSYHFSGKDSVTGILPLKKIVSRDFQWPKLGIIIMLRWPILVISSRANLGFFRTWIVWLTKTVSKLLSRKFDKPSSISCSITARPFFKQFVILSLSISTPYPLTDLFF